jgi:hypothetical protein
MARLAGLRPQVDHARIARGRQYISNPDLRGKNGFEALSYMTYIAVQWHHSNSEYPVEMYSELDIDRNETRKVEIFADGRLRYAGAASQTGDTMLSLEPIPPLNEIASDPQFTPRVISQSEFDSAWHAAQ